MCQRQNIIEQHNRGSYHSFRTGVSNSPWPQGWFKPTVLLASQIWPLGLFMGQFQTTGLFASQPESWGWQGSLVGSGPCGGDRAMAAVVLWGITQRTLLPPATNMHLQWGSVFGNSVMGPTSIYHAPELPTYPGATWAGWNSHILTSLL